VVEAGSDIAPAAPGTGVVRQRAGRRVREPKQIHREGPAGPQGMPQGLERAPRPRFVAPVLVCDTSRLRIVLQVFNEDRRDAKDESMPIVSQAKTA